MRKLSPIFVGFVICAGAISLQADALSSTGTLAGAAFVERAQPGVTVLPNAQNANGALNFSARITPTAARPEPVREFTFYILTKSYADVVKEVEAQNEVPPRDQFIDGLKVSPELKEWLKAHDVFDLMAPGVDRLLTPEDIIHVPEFLQAYQQSNRGGVANGLPRPKYTEADKTERPERYQKQLQEYLATLKKYIQGHPETVSGIELELESVSPQRKWSQIQAEHKKRVLRMAPELAQTKYLAAKADTDLDGQASVALPPGGYWISTLNLDADAGDARLAWDVPVSIEPGRTTRIELSNLNAVEARNANP